MTITFIFGAVIKTKPNICGAINLVCAPWSTISLDITSLSKTDASNNTSSASFASDEALETLLTAPAFLPFYPEELLSVPFS